MNYDMHCPKIKAEGLNFYSDSCKWKREQDDFVDTCGNYPNCSVEELKENPEHRGLVFSHPDHYPSAHKRKKPKPKKDKEPVIFHPYLRSKSCKR